MGITANYSLPYPELTDEPDGAGQIQALAVAVDTELAELAEAIEDIPGGGGGGGSGGYSGGRFVASSAQDIPATVTGIGTHIGFPSNGANMSGDATDITRSASGTNGHRFVLGEGGLWSAHTTIRIAANSAAGELSCAIWADLAGGTNYTFNIAHDGARREGLPRTLTPGAETYLPAGTSLVVAVYNGTGGTRQTEPSGGAWVHLDLWLKG
jgi:hypothetical protein